jgi:phage baseplate assembly protein W
MSNYYGVSFPFQDSKRGDFVRMTETTKEEVRSNLIHLILTRRGSRYFLPEFGTRLYEFIFEQMDGQTFSAIEEDIREACKKFIPNLDIQAITVTPAEDEEITLRNQDPDLDQRIYRTHDESTRPYTAILRIDYTIKNTSVFNTKDFIIINL